MNIDEIDMALRQKQSLERFNNSRGLSNVPNYIQDLSRQMDRIEYKLDIILKAMPVKL